MLFIYCVLLEVIIPFNSAELRIYEEPKSTIAFRNFTLNLKEEFENKNLFTVIGSNKACSGDISEWLLKTHYKPPVIIANEGTDNEQGPKRHVDSEMNVIFLDNVEEIHTVLKSLQRHSFFHVYGNMFFIVCNPIEETNWIEDTCKEIWQKRILNFFLIYYTTQLEVITYNPFFNTYTNYTNIAVNYRDLLNDKLNDLNGYRLCAGSVVDYPRIVYQNGKYYGNDVTFIADIVKHMNATLDISLPSNYIALHGNIKKGLFDFSVATRFIYDFQDLESIIITAEEFTYPFSKEGYTVIAPKGKLRNPILNLFYTFDIYVWILITTVIALITYEIYYIDKILKCPRRDDPFVQTLRIFVNLPTPELEVSVPTKTYLIIFTIWFSVIINIAFQSSLTSALVTARYSKDIDSIKDLEESHLNILISKGFADIIPNTSKLHNQFVYYNNKSRILAMLLDGNTDYAYGINALESAQILVRRINAKFGKDIFTVVKESLIPGYRGYIFTEDSPYLKTIDDLMLLYKEYGLPHVADFAIEHKNILFPESEHFNTNNTNAGSIGLKLSLLHLQTAFYILFMGFLFALLVLFYEIISYKKNRRNCKKKVTKTKFEFIM